MGWGVFHVKGWGAKKFGMSLETQGNQNFFFGGISRDFAGISRQKSPKSLRKKCLGSIFGPCIWPTFASDGARQACVDTLSSYANCALCLLFESDLPRNTAHLLHKNSWQELYRVIWVPTLRQQYHFLAFEHYHQIFNLGGRFGYFLFFFSARGGGRGSPRPPGGGVAEFLLKIPEGGGVSRRRGRGAGRCLQRIGDFWGGGLNIFFRGRNVHQVILPLRAGQEPPLDSHHPWMPGNPSPEEFLSREIPELRNPSVEGSLG